MAGPLEADGLSTGLADHATGVKLLMHGGLRARAEAADRTRVCPPRATSNPKA